MNLKPVAPHRTPGRQLSFLDTPFKSPHEVSPYIGTWTEEYVSLLTDGIRLTTDSKSHCPDIELDPKWYLEVKAIGPRGIATIYKHSYECYKEFCKTNKLQFVFVFHMAGAKQVKTHFQLHRDMAESIYHVLVVPAQTVFKYIESKSWIRSKNKSERYRHYINLTRKFFDPFLDAKPHRPERCFPVTLCGHTTDYVPLRLYRTQWPTQAKIGMWSPEHRDIAQIMLSQLLASWHTVVLTEGYHGKLVREVVERNVWWYEDMVRQYHTGKRGRSVVQRRLVINALERIIQNKPLEEQVEERLLPVMQQVLEYEEERNV